MKRLVVCSDGTWNTADQEEDGVQTPTNVRKIFNAVVEGTVDGVEQRKYYHSGVGTGGGLFARVAGGAYGRGISSNIKSGYQWLARNYEPDDEIFLFGFSRGAFTVRSLAGMLGTSGLLKLDGTDAETGWALVDAVYDEGYRHRRFWSPDGASFHGTEANRSIPVKMVGVWDTVGALGVPDDLEVLNFFDDPQKWQFHDVKLGPNIEVARHALALDELRSSFTPTRWKPDARVKEVWFPGAHSDVGGGYPETGLSDGALKWMIDEARTGELALVFDPVMLDEDIKPNPRDVLHVSFKGLHKALRSRPRATPPVASGRERHDIHASAYQRREHPPMSQAPYKSTVVLEAGGTASADVYARERWNDCGIYLEAGTYDFRATGQWLDSRIRSGPGGTNDGKFHVGEVVHVMSSLWGQAEKLWNRVRDEDPWDFIGTRREEGMPWFALVGVIANDAGGGNPQHDGSPTPHQTFLIGDGTTLTVEEPGHLYAFANDTWSTYGNNRGSVHLVVNRKE